MTDSRALLQDVVAAMARPRHATYRLQLGAALAKTLGAAPAVLMRGHGFNTVGTSIRQATSRAIYTDLNARILTEALSAGGWFDESHEAEVLKAATTPDEEERLTAVRTLLAEETRMGMMIGVAVGWALSEELASDEED